MDETVSSLTHTFNLTFLCAASSSKSVMTPNEGSLADRPGSGRGFYVKQNRFDQRRLMIAPARGNTERHFRAGATGVWHHNAGPVTVGAAKSWRV